MPSPSFEPPGPGSWHLNDEHFPRPLSRYFRGFYLDVFNEAATDASARYGIPLDFHAESVNGYWYTKRRRVDGPADVGSDTVGRPSTPSSSSEFQRRLEAARDTFRSKRWREDVERWDQEWKPAQQDANASLRCVDPTALDDWQLIDHLNDCRSAVIEAAYYHHRLTPCFLLPTGDFLALLRSHTDCSPGRTIALMDGASPASAGAVEELTQVVQEVKSQDHAKDLLFSGDDPAAVMERLQSMDGEISNAIESWLDVVGYQIVTGYDVADAYGLEHPSMLVSTLQTAIEDGGVDVTNEPSGELLDAVRLEVPSEHRGTFDERFEEARYAYRIRDERSLFDLRTLGLARRALLEAGRRLSEGGLLRRSNHVVDLEHDEIVSALQGGPAPPPGEVAAHFSYRTSHDIDDAPDRIGPAPEDPAPMDELPDAFGRCMQALAAHQWANQAEVDASSEPTGEIRGHPASPGSFEGPARIVTDPEEFAAIQPGDVLVADATSSAFNTVLPLLGAIVTDKGGMLSHPAIVAREFGIPGVVGCENATTSIQDGDRILVDGEAGEVRILSV